MLHMIAKVLGVYVATKVCTIHLLLSLYTSRILEYIHMVGYTHTFVSLAFSPADSVAADDATDESDHYNQEKA